MQSTPAFGLLNQSSTPLTTDLRAIDQNKSVLFIDAGVQSAASLVGQVAPGTSVYLLDAGQDAIAQMTQVLSGLSGVDSVQIVSHGRSGGLQLGQSWLDVQSLPSQVAQLKSWGAALSADADILLYGCNVGADAAGKAFVNLLAQATGADVAASDDLTGNAALGGDWDLEVKTGAIESLGLSGLNYGQVLDAEFTWAKGLTGTGDFAPRTTVMDNGGNVYTVGIFNGSIDFSAGNGTNSLTSFGSSDIAVTKHAADGTLVWVKQFGGTTFDTGNSVAVSNTGEVVVVSRFSGTADFDPGNPGNKFASIGGFDSAVVKLNPDGSVAWAKQVATSITDDAIDDVAVDQAGNVYLAGWFTGTADFDPSATGVANLSAVGAATDADAFVSKLNADGSFAWAKQFGGNGIDDQTDSVAVDNAGNVYSTGLFGGNATATTVNGNVTLTGIGGSRDIFVNKFDANGNLLWVNQFGGAGEDLGQDIAVDSSGNSYLAGFFSGNASFGSSTSFTNNGARDAVVAKLDTNGQVVWAKQIGNAGDDEVSEIVVSASNKVYVAGTFTNSLNIDLGGNPTTFTSQGAYDAFVTGMNADGSFAWLKPIGGAGDDASRGIAISGIDDIRVAVEFRSETLNLGNGVPSLTIASGRDAGAVIRLKDTDLNKAPTDVAFSGLDNIVAENSDLTQRRRVANIEIFDDGLGTNNLTLTGADAASFEIDNKVLYLKAGTVLSYETKQTYKIAVSVDDSTIGNTPDQTQQLTITVADTDPTISIASAADGNEAGPVDGSFQITLSQASTVPLTVNYSLAGTALAGTDYTMLVGNGISNITATSFTIGAGITNATLVVKVSDDAISELDETVSLTLGTNSSYILGTGSANLNIITNDANVAPTGITFTNLQTTFTENSDSTQRRQVADIVVADDGLGTNTLSLGGADAASFEIDNGVLYMKAGVALSFETKPQYDVTVSVDDISIGNTPDATTALTVQVRDVDPILTVGSGINANEAGATDGTFTLALSQASAIPITVTYNLSGTATEGADYTIVAGTGISNITATEFTIDAGIQNATLLIKINDDSVVDLNESVTLNLLPNNHYKLLQVLPESSFAVGTNPGALVIGDLNADGLLDIVTANAGSNDISVLLGDGSGSFTTAGNYSVGSQPAAIVIGDFNNDSQLDIATGNAASPNISILLGNGTGGFGTPLTLDIAMTVNSLIASDINQDGNLDLIASGQEADQSIAVLLNNGLGDFAAPIFSNAAANRSGIAVGELTGLSGLDVIASGPVATIIMQGDGTGALNYESKLYGYNTKSVELADLNNDGKLDIIIDDANDQSITTFMGNGRNLGFYEGDKALIGQPIDFEIADIDGDGNRDIVAIKTDKKIVVLFNNGTLYSETFIATGVIDTSENLSALRLGDVNNDGLMDIIAVQSTTNQVAVFLQQAPTATLKIVDNDPAINIIAGITPVEDTDTNGSFSIALNAASPDPITVNYSLAGTATLGDDYTIVAGNGISNVTATSFTIDAGVTNATLSLAVVNDTVREGDETIDITLSINPIPGNANTTPFINDTASLTIGASDPNQAPTAISFNNTQLAIAENADVTQRIKVADIVITDDGQGVNVASLGGADAANFEIDGDAVYLKAGSILSYETKPQYDIDIIVDDSTVGSTPDLTQSLTIAVTDVDPVISITPGTPGNEAGPTNGSFNITLDQASATPITVNYNLAGTATNLDDYTIATGTGISNITATSFTIDAGVTSATLSVNVIDDTVSELDETIELSLLPGDAYGLTTEVASLSILTNDANEAPTRIAMNDLVLTLPETADTTQPVKVAKILVVDDNVGLNKLSVSGADADKFEIIGNFLYLKAGTALSYEAKAKYTINVEVDDATVGDSPDATEVFNLAILDVAPVELPALPTPVDPNAPEVCTTRITKRDRITREVTVRVTSETTNISTTQAVTYGQRFTGQVGETVKLDDKWRIIDTADLDNDGMEDILFQNSTDDEIGVWYLGAGGTIKSLDYLRDTSGNILRTGRNDWKAIGLSAAVPGQQRSLVWQNTVTDEIGLWFLNRGSNIVTSYDYLRNADGSVLSTQANKWEIAGLGNFDSTAGSEILLHSQDTNQTAILQTNGSRLMSFQSIQSFADRAWSIQGTGDLDRDGRSEIIWGNPATQQTVMQKTVLSSEVIVSTVFELVTITETDCIDFVTNPNLEDNLG
jgi:hypothetical protein